MENSKLNIFVGIFFLNQMYIYWYSYTFAFKLIWTKAAETTRFIKAVSPDDVISI